MKCISANDGCRAMKERHETIKNQTASPVKRIPDLIYDIGMHKGEDTAYYLKKGFRVVAFEANPELIALGRQKFADAIKDRRLTIVEGAITKDSLAGPTDLSVSFFKNETLSVWGTVDASFAERSEHDGFTVTRVDVPVVDLIGCIAAHGVPYFMKVDIEGMDYVCLKALSCYTVKPAYVSIESEKSSFGKLVQELQWLVGLGYTSFQAVQQFGIPGSREPVETAEGTYAGHCFPDDASGVFGKDLRDIWLDYEGIINRYYDIFLSYRRFGDSSWIGRHALPRNLVYAFSRLIRYPIPGWYDTHARHESVEASRES